MAVDVNELFKQIEALRSQLTSAVQTGNITVQGPEPILDDDTPDGARQALTRFHASVAHNPDTIHRALANQSLLINDLHDRVKSIENARKGESDKAKKLVADEEE